MIIIIVLLYIGHGFHPFFFFKFLEVECQCADDSFCCFTGWFCGGLSFRNDEITKKLQKLRPLNLPLNLT